MRNEWTRGARGITRRTFLGALGAGIVAGSASAAIPGRATAQGRGEPVRADRFGRMFPDLPPFADPGPDLDAALRALGEPGGVMDAGDALDRGARDLILDPTFSLDNPDNPTHTAGTTFMGQFLDHDMTFDIGSPLGEPTDPGRSRNARTPAFDLDSVYGGGPDTSPELYEARGRGRGDSRRRESAAKFRIESGGLFEDLPRHADGRAIIADPRNDENLMIAGLHAAVLSFHNRAVDLLLDTDRRAPSHDVFRRARQLTTWHYQWMIVHEFLPLFVGPAMVEDVLARGRRFYRPRRAFMPVEFQGAAYRFGHSMVRPSYRANLQGDDGQPFFGLIFDPTQADAADPDDLRGGVRAPRRFIGWQTFFDFGDGEVRPNKRIDTTISTPLFDLPLGAIASGEPPTSLPQRNLLRHVTWQLPSGQSIAEAMDAPVLLPEDFPELASFGLGLERSTPLWYYVLREAEVMEEGLRLGPVGGRIVAEVVLGLLQLDRQSYLAAQPDWRPVLPTRSGRVTGDFRMVDFLAFAGVDPASRGQ